MNADKGRQAPHSEEGAVFSVMRLPTDVCAVEDVRAPCPELNSDMAASSDTVTATTSLVPARLLTVAARRRKPTPTMTDQFLQMGARRRRRDQTASDQAGEQAAIDERLRTAGVLRWPLIVDAIRRLTASYNQGAGFEALAIVEGGDRQHPSVTIRPASSSQGTLVVTLVASELSVQIVPAAGTVDATRWLDLSRTDEQTAAYILKNWLEQL